MKQLSRTAHFDVHSTIDKVFPLLCPKREEEWIPGWECETLWSRSGYNEEGAVFRTRKPYGTELYWTTLKFDIGERTVDFLNLAPGLYLFRFVITVEPEASGTLRIVFSQTFTPISEEGDALIRKYEAEDLGARLQALAGFMTKFLNR